MRKWVYFIMITCLCMGLTLPSAKADAEKRTLASLGERLRFVKMSAGVGVAICDQYGQTTYMADQPVVLTVAQGLTMKAITYAKGYDEIDVQTDAIWARAEICTDQGSRFWIEDAYTQTAQGIVVDRQVKVVEVGKNDRGFRSEISFAYASDTPMAYDKLEYMIPALFYKTPQDMAPAAVFSQGTFSHNRLMVRETRSALPMVMMRHPQTGEVFSIAHIAEGIADVVTADSAGQNTRLDSNCHYGAIGIHHQGATPAVCFTYPYQETPIIYRSTSANNVCYHPIQIEQKHCYKLLLYAAHADDFNEAMINCYQTNFSAQPIEIKRVDTRQLYDACMADLDALYTRNGQGVGFPFAVYVDNGELFAVNFQMGFIGMQIPLAHHMIRYGVLKQDESIWRKGVSIVDFWAAKAKTDSGVVKVWFDSVDFRPYPPFLRIMTDGMEGMLDAMLAIEELGLQVDTSAWSDMVKRYADFLVESQNPDGSFYRAYDYKGNAYTDTNEDGLIGDKNTFGDSKLNSAIPVRFLVRMYEATAQECYLIAAKAAGDFVLKNLYPTGHYVGGTPDNPNTVDKEAGIYATYAYSALYAVTGDVTYLDAMEQAATYAFSWTYVYSFSVANLQHLQAGIPSEMGLTDGLSFIATGHSAVDNYIAFLSYEMFKLYVWTGKDIYRQMGLFLENNAKQTVDLQGDFGFVSRSMMIEATTLATFVFRTAETRGVWLPWITCANIEPILNMVRTFSQPNIDALKDVPLSVLKEQLGCYGAGGLVR